MKIFNRYPYLIAEIGVNFYGKTMLILCNYEEEMKEIFKKYKNKKKKDVNIVSLLK